MKKRLLLLLFVVFVSLSFRTVNAMDYSVADATEIATEANEQIGDLILEAQEQAQENPDQIDKIVLKLIRSTELISEKAIKEINKMGFDANCEYVTIIVGNIEITVDPIRVHTW